MAISYQNSLNSSNTGSTGSPFSFAFDVGSGSNRGLWMVVNDNGSSGDSSGATVTYAGVSMTQVGYVKDNQNCSYEAFYLLNPTSGSNNITVTPPKTSNWRIQAMCYNGVNQSLTYTGTPTDNFATHTDSSVVTDASITVSTIQNNSWVISMARQTAIGATNIAAGTNTTGRTLTTIFGNGDSGALITPAGSYTNHWTTVTADEFLIFNLTVSPAVAPTGPANVKTWDGVTQSTGVKTYEGLALASTKSVIGVS